jgi:hypothetical protein
MSWIGIALVAVLAKADEDGVGVLEFRLAAVDPEIAPFLFEEIDIVAGGDRPRVVIGFRVEDREQGLFCLRDAFRQRLSSPLSYPRSGDEIGALRPSCRRERERL